MINKPPAGYLDLLLPHRRAIMLFASLHSTLICVLIILFSNFVIICHGSCNQLDRDSLLSSTVSISSPYPLNWSIAADCCTWEGVVCDDHGRVSRLWLPSRKLIGNISPALTNITFLSQLNLSRNSLSGLLPDGFFKSLNQLQVIDLSNNRLAGQLPDLDMLSNTTETVDLSSNQFNGTVQVSFFQGAMNLVSLNISNNSFSGLNPAFVCNFAPSISILDFSVNGFVGPILEDVGNCSNLLKFRAGFNALSGPLPDGIYRMFKLQELFLPKTNDYYSSDSSAICNHD